MNRFITLLFFFAIGCTHTQSHFPERSFYIKLKPTDSVEILAGHIQLIDTVDSYELLMLTFDRVRGGKTRFLGMTINETDGYEEKRLKIYKNTKVYEFSIYELGFYVRDTVKLIHDW